MSDDRILQHILEINKPTHVQGVADMLAQFGIKKPTVQRALDALAEEGKITCKEFGKAKIYFAPQADSPVLSKDELSALASRKTALEEQLRAASLALARHKAALAKADAEIPPEVVGQRIAAANSSISELEAKLSVLRAEGAPPPVKAEDMASASKKLSSNLDAWAKRRSVFKEVWDAVSENLDTKNPRDLYDEIGVETDEAAGVSLASLRALVLPASRGLAGFPCKVRKL